MAGVSTYLNFMGDTLEAFEFYREVFGTEFRGPVLRNRDVPGMPETMTESDLDGIMHIELPILGGHVIMATDMLESMGHDLRVGNNVTINLEPDTREDTERLFARLSEGSTEMAPLQDTFWGYWGVCLDRFGIRWMFNGPAATTAA